MEDVSGKFDGSGPYVLTGALFRKRNRGNGNRLVWDQYSDAWNWSKGKIPTGRGKSYGSVVCLCLSAEWDFAVVLGVSGCGKFVFYSCCRGIRDFERLLEAVDTNTEPTEEDL